MGERTRWSPGVLFREIRADPDRILFRYPARTQGLIILLGAVAFGLAAGLIFIPLTEPGLERFIGHLCIAVFWLPFTVVGIHRLWIVRTLEVDLARREVTLTRRSPLGQRREVLGFETLKAVTLEESDGVEPNPAERHCIVVVKVDRGPDLELGHAPRPGARDFANRLGELTGVPVRIGAPGPRNLPGDHFLPG